MSWPFVPQGKLKPRPTNLRSFSASCEAVPSGTRPIVARLLGTKARRYNWRRRGTRSRPRRDKFRAPLQLFAALQQREGQAPPLRLLRQGRAELAGGEGVEGAEAGGEFGSPKLPMIREAMAFHYLDDLDSKLAAVRVALASGAGDEEWSAYSNALGRKFLKLDEFLKTQAAAGTAVAGE
jgi:hypothetical protein